MAAAAKLPPRLQDKFAALAQQIRTRRACRGVGWLLLTLVGGAAAAVAADSLFGLSAQVRYWLLGSWAAAGLLVAWLGLFRPLSRPLSNEDLAALIEDEYPSLGERLSASVDLAEHADAGNGSPRLIRMLLRDADQRARRIRFQEAVSWAGTLWMSLAAAVILLAGMAALVAGDIRGDVRRFFAPWYTPPVRVDYRLEVPSGSATVKQDDPVVLSAVLRPTADGVELPEAATLTVRQKGREAEHAMRSAREADRRVFTHEVAEPGDGFEYRVTAGELESDWYTVKVVPRLALDGGTHMLIRAPEYAAAEPLRVEGLRDLTPEEAVWQHGSVELRVKLTAKPAAAYLIEVPRADPAEAEEGEPKGPAAPKFRRRDLVMDGTAGGRQITFTHTRRLKLVLDYSEGVAAEEIPILVLVRKDKPPAFRAPQGRAPVDGKVRPDESIPVRVEVGDDLGLTEFAMEYRVDRGGKEGEVQSKEVPARLPIPTQGEIDFQLKPADFGLKDGDGFVYRLRATDNRDIPEAGLKPQVSYDPPTGWKRLTVAADAAPADQREADARLDKIREMLERLIAKLVAEQRRIYKLKQEAKGHPLELDQQGELKGLIESHAEGAKLLAELAEEAAAVPQWRPLADLARDVADKEMRAAAESLKKAAEPSAPPPRDAALKAADGQVGKAIERLDKLKDMADKAAQRREAAKKIDELRREQENLEAKAKEADDPEKLKDIAREQQKLKDELDKVVEKDDELKKAMEAGRREQAKDLGQEADKLADAQKDLEDAMKDGEKQDREAEAGDLLKAQRELTKRAEELAARTKKAARNGRLRPLDDQDSRKAEDALKADDLDAALKDQAKNAAELRRLADQLGERATPRERAKALARMQEELRKRAAAGEDRDKLAREQKGIEDAARRLRVGKQEKADKDRAADAARDAADALSKKEGDADAEMRKARDELNSLAGKLPDKAEVARRAREAVDRLAKKQEQLNKEVAAANREAAERDPDDPKTRDELADRLQGLTRRQAKLAQELRDLDVPEGHQGRLERTRRANERALDDMIDARPQDIPASQKAAGRQLKRLKQALDGEEPADAKADRLAKKQRELADRADRLAKRDRPDRREAERLQREQQKLNDELKKLDAPEAADRLSRAKRAAQEAADEAEKKDDRDRLAKKQREAADRLQKLADQMGGGESDREKAERLAKRQKDAADRLAKKPEPKPEDGGRADRLQRELDNLRAGRDAQREKKQADEALGRLRKAEPEGRAAAEKDAADALQRLADKMSPDKAEARPRRDGDADQLSREQQKLADKTARAKTEGEKREAAEGQDRLAKEAERMGTEGAPEAMQKAREAMRDAKRAMRRGDQAGAEKAQRRAADALERAGEERRDAGRPDELPNRDDARRARELARDQEELRERVQKTLGDREARAGRQPGDNPAGGLADRQQKLAEQARRLADEAAKTQGQKSSAARQSKGAADAADQAARRAQAGQFGKAQQDGKETADRLREMARRQANNPTGDRAKKLADEQAELNEELRRAGGDPEARRAQQAARQERLKRQAGDLARRMREQADKTPGPRGDQMRRAAEEAKKAGESMKQAQREGEGNKPGNRARAQQRAEQQLRRAADQAKQAGQPRPGEPRPGEQQRQLGKALQQAREQMGRAGRAAQQGQAGQAGRAMKQAGEALKRAAGKADPKPGQPKPGDEPGQNDGQKAGDPTKGKIDRAAIDGEFKDWGRMPGELRTKLIQAARRRYGDDYARSIKMYFEQTARRKKSP